MIIKRKIMQPVLHLIKILMKRCLNIIIIQKNWKVKKKKTLRQTKSYVNKKKYNFLQRRNTYNKSELKANYSFNISLDNNSKDKKE